MDAGTSNLTLGEDEMAKKTNTKPNGLILPLAISAICQLILLFLEVKRLFLK